MSTQMELEEHYAFPQKLPRFIYIHFYCNGFSQQPLIPV